MRSFLVFGLLVFLALSLGGCGSSVDVPPGHVGKKLDGGGLSKETYPPGRVWLTSFCLTCPKLVIAEVSDMPVEERLRVFMPSDKLNLTVDLRGLISVRQDENSLQMLFQNVPARECSEEEAGEASNEGSGSDSRVLCIKGSDIYNRYVRPVIRTYVRDLIQGYTIEDFMARRNDIARDLARRLNEATRGTPVSVVYIGFADIQLPKAIVEAYEQAKWKEVELAKVEAQKLIEIKRAEARLEVAKKQQEVDLKEAETQVLVNKKLAEGVSEAFVVQRWLQVIAQAMNSGSGNFFILPYEAVQNPFLLMPAVDRQLGKNGSAK